MGFLLIVGTAIISTVLFLLSFSAVKNPIKIKNEIQEYALINTSAYYSKFSPTTLSKDEQVKTLLIRACQEAQSLILQCQNCYAEGNFLCTEPNPSFCVSARGVNPNDADIVWSFLPNSEGSLTDIYTASDKNIRDITSINELGAGIRWLIKMQVSRKFLQGYRYKRPSGNLPDACAVEGVLTK